MRGFLIGLIMGAILLYAIIGLARASFSNITNSKFGDNIKLIGQTWNPFVVKKCPQYTPELCQAEFPQLITSDKCPECPETPECPQCDTAAELCTTDSGYYSLKPVTYAELTTDNTLTPVIAQDVINALSEFDVKSIKKNKFCSGVDNLITLDSDPETISCSKLQTLFNDDSKLPTGCMSIGSNPTVIGTNEIDFNAENFPVAYDICRPQNNI